MEFLRTDSFPTPIWETDLKDIDLNSIKQYIENMKSLSFTSSQVSNRGGWQSITSNKIPPEASFEHLYEVIQLAINSCADNIELDISLELQNYWFNINEFGNYNVLHNHRGGILSGVFYIDSENEQSGKIRFHRDDDINYFLPKLTKYNLVTASSIDYTPIKGKLIIFPSWLKHSVETNSSQCKRISMSFNYGIKKQ